MATAAAGAAPVAGTLPSPPSSSLPPPSTGRSGQGQKAVDAGARSHQGGSRQDAFGGGRGHGQCAGAGPGQHVRHPRPHAARRLFPKAARAALRAAAATRAASTRGRAVPHPPRVEKERAAHHTGLVSSPPAVPFFLLRLLCPSLACARVVFSLRRRCHLVALWSVLWPRSGYQSSWLALHCLTLTAPGAFGFLP